MLGGLGDHARGRILATVVGAEPGDPPAAGIALAFGKEAQVEDGPIAGWVEWAQQPGRVLVLLPPFARGGATAPTRWEARRTAPMAGGEGPLAKLLAAERQHEVRGELVPVERVGGQVVTATWRRHPAAGLFVVTALPLWSLRVLEHPDDLHAWLAARLEEAGAPRADQAEPVADFVPAESDWAMLLHLCTADFVDERVALSTLATSPWFRMDAETARDTLARLREAEWVDGTALTQAGRDALNAGPHAVYARALEAVRHVG